MTAPISFYLVISALLFGMGLLGVALRHNAIAVFMCIEMMLNAVNLAFVAFSRMHGGVSGQVVVFFVMVLAAAESAIALAIIISVFRAFKSVDISTAASELKG